MQATTDTDIGPGSRPSHGLGKVDVANLTSNLNSTSDSDKSSGSHGESPAMNGSTTQNVGDRQRKETVAIIGSGMAGLVTAHLLQRDARRRFEVEVLEMQDKLSLDSASYVLPKSVPRLKAEAEGKDKDEGGSSSTSSSADEKEPKEKDQGGEGEGEGEEEDRRVDLPMRAFAAGYYDNLIKMYAYLGVGFGQPRFVYSVSSLDSSSSSTKEGDGKGGGGGRPYFIHSSNNHILPPIRPPGMGVLRWVVEVVYLLFWYAWFTGACFWVSPKSTPTNKKRTRNDAENALPAGSGETLSSYFNRIHLPKYYTHNYFLPLMSSITTCTHDQLLSFPASDIIGYARATYRQPHYTITRGVRQAEEKLAGGLRVRFCTRVEGVKSVDSGVQVSWTDVSKLSGEGSGSASAPEKDAREQGDGNGKSEKIYDRVIIATTPDVVGNILAPLSNAMKAIPTTSVSTLVHRDLSRIRHISSSLSQNSRLKKRGIKTFDSNSSFSPSFASNTNTDTTTSPQMPLTAMHMITDKTNARTESIHEHPANVLVTTYALEDSINEEEVLHRVRFTRVLRSARSRDLVNGIFETGSVSKEGDREKDVEKDATMGEGGWKNGDGNVYLVGGWCWDGMVLLEGCVVSAMRVAGELGVDVPWV